MDKDDRIRSPNASGPVRQTASFLFHPSKRTVLALALLIIGLLGLLGVAWETITNSTLPTDGIRVSGVITGNDTSTDVGASSGSGSSDHRYFLAFSYQVQGTTYDGRWEAPDQSWLARMPAGTSITVSYPIGEPGLGKPIGYPFDDVHIDPLGIALDILIEGAFPILMIVAGIALLRGVWRGRMILTRGKGEPLEVEDL